MSSTLTTVGGKPAKPFLSARWEHLLMLNYEVDPEILAPHVPSGTTIDTFEGKTFASMVAFRFLDTRVLGIPIPFHRDFEEINLRFYVRHETQGEIRRGVVFVREIVPRFAIAFVARKLYEENYVAMPTRHSIEFRADDTSVPAKVRYAWKFGQNWNSISATTVGDAFELVDGTQEEFIAEHYWGYTKRKRRPTAEYRVEHPRWRVWNVESPELDCDVAALYGSEFGESFSGPPSSAFLAEGSEVIVRMGTSL